MRRSERDRRPSQEKIYDEYQQLSAFLETQHDRYLGLEVIHTKEMGRGIKVINFFLVFFDMVSNLMLNS